LNFNQIKKHYQKLRISIEEQEFYKRTAEVIEKIKTSVELAHDLAKIATEVLEGLINSIRYGFTPHNITKEKLKQTINVLKKLGELESTTEEQKQTINFLSELARQAIANNRNIPSEKYNRRGW